VSQKSTRKGAGREILRWRRDQLVAAGFPSPLAALVAKDGCYDVHALIELVEQGCRPGLAVRILAPLDGADRT
jgi:hypothetical protein